MAAIQENYSCSSRPDPGGDFCRLDVFAEVPISCLHVRRLVTQVLDDMSPVVAVSGDAKETG